jgi:hypothetical protein
MLYDEKYAKSQFAGKIKGMVQEMDSIRRDKDRPVDISLGEYLSNKHEMDLESFYTAIGVDPSFDTVSNFFTTPSDDVRWLVPEIFREAIRLGYRQSPIWPRLTAMEENTAGLSQIMPHINMSDATPKKVGEAESIPVGTLSYGEKKFSIYKYGRGIKITDEVRRYVSLSVLSIYLQDFGVKMGYGVDNLALEVLINGEQSNGSEAAPVVGVGSVGDITFRDILRVWLRMAKIGRKPQSLVNGENMALDIMYLDEFINPLLGTPMYKLNPDVSLPQGADMYIHGAVGTDQTLVVDPTSALIKLNAQPLTVESERIVSNQTEAVYVTFATGFAKLFTDAALIIDTTKDFASNGFPDWMDYLTELQDSMTGRP